MIKAAQGLPWVSGSHGGSGSSTLWPTYFSVNPPLYIFKSTYQLNPTFKITLALTTFPLPFYPTLKYTPEGPGWTLDVTVTGNEIAPPEEAAAGLVVDVILAHFPASPLKLLFL